MNILLDPTTIPGALFYAILVLIFAYGIGQFLHWAVQRRLTRVQAAGADATSVRFLGQLAKVAVYIVALVVYTRLIPPLQSLGTAWLASAGVLSVVIGLATQSTLSNLVAGISIIIYRPVRLGERIQVATPTGNDSGIVESIDLGYTTLRASDGRRIVLPNSLVANQTNINYSRNYPHVLSEIPITIAVGGSIEKARDILVDAAKNVKKVNKVNGCFVTNLTAAGTVLTLSVLCIDPSDIAAIKSEILEKAKQEFDAAKIAVAG